MKKLLIILSISLTIIACKKEIDHPPIQTLEDGQILRLDTLIAMYSGTPIKFEKDISVYGTVTMDESDGNIYKQVFLQADDKAINIRLLSSGNLFEGDYIRINLKNTVLNKYAGVMQLDSVNFETNIAIQESGKPLEAMIVTIADLDSSFNNILASEPANPNIIWKYSSKLIKLENVQFSNSEVGGTYADGPAQQSKNVVIEDCDGNQIILRSSGYSNFANELIATGNGSITVIASRYNSDLQLVVRSFNEIDMSGTRCSGQLFNLDFEDNTNPLGGWQYVDVNGNIPWASSYFSNNNFAKISNWDGSSNTACESWFISPEIDLTNSTTSSLTFLNDVRYSGPALELLVSTDFSGSGDPSQNGTWVDISNLVTWDSDSGSWGFVDGGNISLDQFLGNTIRIAFKYTGTSSNGATWELDDIKVNG